MRGSERCHVSFEFFDSGEHFIALLALETALNRFSGFCIGSMARERALGFEHNHAFPHELLHHRIDRGRKWDAHPFRRFFRVISQLFIHFYGQGCIHTDILLLVRFTVKAMDGLS